MPIKTSASLISLTPIDAGFQPRVKSAGPSYCDCQSFFQGPTQPSNKGHHGSWEMSFQCKLGHSQIVGADKIQCVMSDPLVVWLDMVTFILHATHIARWARRRRVTPKNAAESVQAPWCHVLNLVF